MATKKLALNFPRIKFPSFKKKPTVVERVDAMDTFVDDSFDAPLVEPKVLPIIGGMPLKDQYSTIVFASVMSLSLSLVMAFFSVTLSGYRDKINVDIGNLAPRIKQLTGEVSGASTGDADSFMAANVSQNVLSGQISELSEHSNLSATELISLPTYDKSFSPVDFVWHALMFGSVDLTERLQTVLNLQNEFTKILITQPQFGFLSLNAHGLATEAQVVADKLDYLRSAGAGGSASFDAFAANIEEMAERSRRFVNSGANQLDLAAFSRARNLAIATAPNDLSGSAADAVNRVVADLKGSLAKREAVTTSSFNDLSQNLSLQMSKVTSLSDDVSKAVSVPIGSPFMLTVVWSVAGFMFLVGVALLSLLMAISAKAAELAAYQARREQRETDIAVETIMKELKPIAAGDLTSRMTVTEHTTGVVADRINVTAGSIRETLQLVREASREVEGSIEDIYEQSETTKMLTGDALSESQASREASEKGVSAVSMAVERAHKQRESMQDVSKRVKHLGEVAQSITRMTDLIEQVAGKTEVLAINTSLKAADAGDEGGAFRVIAAEIRKLTIDTRHSLQEIYSSVQSMLGETNLVIKTVEGVTAEVVDSERFWDGAMNSLSAIRDYTTNVDKLMAKVSESSLVQTKAASDAVTVMNKLNGSVSRFRTHESEPMPESA